MNDIFSALRTKGREIAAGISNPSFRDRIGRGPGIKTSDATAIAATLAGDERPYFVRGQQASIPPEGVCLEILRRTGNPELVRPDEREKLRLIQRRIDRCAKSIKALGTDGLMKTKRDSEKRLATGRASKSDAEFSRSDLIAGRKTLKKQQRALVESAHPVLVEVTKRFEKLSRQVLPAIESESIRLGVPPHQVPLVLGIAAAAWAPSICAAQTAESPRRFLKALGIQL